MTPHHSIALAADSRKEMEEWMNIVKQAAVIRTDNSVSLSSNWLIFDL